MVLGTKKWTQKRTCFGSQTTQMTSQKTTWAC